MSSTAAKNETIERRKKMEDRFSKVFEVLYINETLCFKKSDETIFSLCTFSGEAAIVIEYAENYDEAQINRFEDGDRFYLEDLDEETMYQKMLEEIGV